MKTTIFELVPSRRYRSYRQLAKAMGISTAQLSRVQHGQRFINGLFITAALRAFPEKSFEELFIVDREPGTTEVA